jgi:hypothetical protein
MTHKFMPRGGENAMAMSSLAELVEGWDSPIPIHREIWAYLVGNAMGRDKRVTAAQIAAAVGIDDNSQQTLTREIIGDMVRRGAPIAANSRGFFVATHRKDLLEYSASLRGREDGICSRRRSVDATIASLGDGAPGLEEN